MKTATYKIGIMKVNHYLLIIYLSFFTSLGSFERPFEENHALLAKSPEEATDWKLDLIRGAEKRIYMMAGYSSGAILGKTLSIFEELLSSKPELKIWFFASNFPGFVTEADASRMKAMSSMYPNRFHYLVRASSENYKQAEGLFNTENHAKLLIVDEKFVLLGGTNLVDNLSRSEVKENNMPSGMFLPKAALDQDIVLWGSSFHNLKMDFFRVWEMFEMNHRFENSLGESYTTSNMPSDLAEEEKGINPFIETHPEGIFPVHAKTYLAGPRVNHHQIQEDYAKLIAEAKSEIQMGQLYFFPVAKIFDRLLEAANRNVKIMAMTNGFWNEYTPKESTLWFFVHRSRVHYFPIMMGRHFSLLQSTEARKATSKNVEIYELNEDYVMYHKKSMTVDGKFTVIGSYNFGQKSAYSDYEVVTVIDSKEATAQINAILQADRSRGTLITKDVAYGWYYNPAYALAAGFQGSYADGILFSLKKPPKPSFVEPKVAEMESFLINGG